MSGIPVKGTLAQTGVGATTWIPMNRFGSDDVSLVVQVTGTVTYTVELTLTPIQGRGSDPGNEVVADHATLVDMTASASGNIDFPVCGVRLTVTAGAGTASLQVNQGSL